MYKQEVIDQQAKIDSLKERNEDEYVIKKQVCNHVADIVITEIEIP